MTIQIIAGMLLLMAHSTHECDRKKRRVSEFTRWGGLDQGYWHWFSFNIISHTFRYIVPNWYIMCVIGILSINSHIALWATLSQPKCTYYVAMILSSRIGFFCFQRLGLYSKCNSWLFFCPINIVAKCKKCQIKILRKKKNVFLEDLSQKESKVEKKVKKKRCNANYTVDVAKTHAHSFSTHLCTVHRFDRIYNL